MMVIFRRLSLPGKIGLIAGLLGGLAGAAVAIIASPLFGTAFTLILAAIIYFALRMSFGSLIRQEALMKSGVQAEATILEVRDTGMTVNEIYPVVKLVLEVRPAEGEPYRAEVRELINRLDIPTYQPGTVLPILYDPGNPKKVAVGAREDLASGWGGTAFTAADADDPEKMCMAREFLEKEDGRSAEIRRSGKPALAKILTATPLGINVNGNNPAMTFMLEGQTGVSAMAS